MSFNLKNIGQALVEMYLVQRHVHSHTHTSPHGYSTHTMLTAAIVSRSFILKLCQEQEISTTGRTAK